MDRQVVIERVKEFVRTYPEIVNTWRIRVYCPGNEILDYDEIEEIIEETLKEEL